MSLATPPNGAYWDDIAIAVGQHDPSATWRAYMQAAYRDLLTRWFAGTHPGPTLKTDLFEEAVTPHHLFHDLGTQGIGLDVSPGVVHSAARRLSLDASVRSAPLLVADLRHVPLADGCLQRILSGSSLDHFEHKRDIAVALAELERCLAPGGVLVVTFDNPHNPVVRLRNGLPFRWMAAVKLVPYFVGATYTRTEVRRTLTALGLRITDESAIVHVPRAPAIWISVLRERLGRRGVSATLLRLFRTWDRLESTVLRYRTGYYLAVRVEKPPGETGHEHA
ncbi:MAG: class I SAM-dependent methyltransferase [Gemmatimonadaceae bacterium]|nr:class I SAM-dependent methyltransferase [Gemmatimonadaceae bacterium]